MKSKIHSDSFENVSLRVKRWISLDRRMMWIYHRQYVIAVRFIVFLAYRISSLFCTIETIMSFFNSLSQQKIGLVPSSLSKRFLFSSKVRSHKHKNKLADLLNPHLIRSDNIMMILFSSSLLCKYSYNVNDLFKHTHFMGVFVAYKQFKIFVRFGWLPINDSIEYKIETVIMYHQLVCILLDVHCISNYAII